MKVEDRNILILMEQETITSPWPFKTVGEMAAERLQCRSNSNGKCQITALTVEVGTEPDFTGLETWQELAAGEEAMAS